MSKKALSWTAIPQQPISLTPSSTMAEKVDAWAANGKKILPGDTLEIHVELLSERAEKAIATCKCAVYTAGDLAAETGGTITMR